MSSLSKTKREYLRLASRFLKEVGLYDLWRQYIYDQHNFMSWLQKSDYQLKECDILGCTCFTDYVIAHRPQFKSILGGYCVYEIYTEYLRKLNPIYEDKLHYESTSHGMVSVNKEKKKVTLGYYCK